MPCWIHALTPTPCTMSNSMLCAIQNNIDKSNPFQSDITPHPYDLSSQPPSLPITANSFIGSPLQEDKPDNVFHLLCGNPNSFNLGPQGGDFIDYCMEVYRFQADTLCLYEHNLDSYNHVVKNILYKPHNAPLIIPNSPPPAVLFQQHLHSNQAAL